MFGRHTRYRVRCAVLGLAVVHVIVHHDVLPTRRLHPFRPSLSFASNIAGKNKMDFSNFLFSFAFRSSNLPYVRFDSVRTADIRSLTKRTEKCPSNFYASYYCRVRVHCKSFVSYASGSSPVLILSNQLSKIRKNQQ